MKSYFSNLCTIILNVTYKCKATTKFARCDVTLKLGQASMRVHEAVAPSWLTVLNAFQTIMDFM
jgi:hypothetical protein